MSKKIELYPVISEAAIEKLNPRFPFELSYTKNEEDVILEYTKTSENSANIYISNNGEWNPSKDNFKFKGTLILSNTNILYEEHAIANKETVIGIALTAYSKITKVNFSKSIGEIKYINNNDDQILLNFEFVFNKSTLNQKFSVELSFYVKDASPGGVFANINGTTLGTLLTYNFILEGPGSIFPIELIEDVEKPLWTMSINYDDITDEFSIRTISIKINMKHQDFKYLGKEDINESNYYLWKEILSSFFINLITYAKDDYERILEEEFDEGTIGNFLNYIVKNFEVSKLEIENPIVLSEKMRIIMDKIIK